MTSDDARPVDADGPVAQRPVDVFVAVMGDAGAPLDASRLQQRLVARGVEPAVARALWRRAQPALRRHPDVVFDRARGTYRTCDSTAGRETAGAGSHVPPWTAEEALERLLPGRLSGRQAELAAVVRAALKERDDLEARVRAAYVGARELQAARDRQVRIEAVRALADVAAEVEELAAAGAAPTVTVERIRALVRVVGLEPLGRAGETTTFAPAWQHPIGSRGPDEERITVIRPGYSWRDGADVVLIHKAQIAWSTA